MKRNLLFLVVLFPLSISAQDYDKYIPMNYTPARYWPKQPTDNDTNDMVAVPSQTLGNLYKFISLTKQYPNLKSSYLGKWEKYTGLYEKLINKESWDYVIKNGQMRYFQHDWDILYQYNRDYQRDLFIKDSLAFRKAFVSDSTRARKEFLLDSLKFRHKFVQDSIYRDAYCINNNYDYVVFDGPHGKPILCFRGGKPINGYTRNKYNLPETVYENGVITHEYTYSAEYLYKLKKITSDERNVMARERDNRDFYNTWYISYAYEDWHYSFIHDEIQHSVSYYKGTSLCEVMYYEKRGERIIPIKRQEILADKISKEILFTYFSDNSTISKTVEYSHSPYEKMRVIEYYSSGVVKNVKEYQKNSDTQKYVLRMVSTHMDGYSIVEEYDFDGNFERR